VQKIFQGFLICIFLTWIAGFCGFWVTVWFFEWNEEADGVVVHSLGFSAEGSEFESRPRPSESIILFSSFKLIPSTQKFTNVDSLEFAFVGFWVHRVSLG
jgi:hypothetical protein